MYLTKDEEKIINGEEGWAKAKALQVIVSVGDSLEAEKLIDISHAHISGVSYSNIGDPGRKLIKMFADSGVRFSVPSTVNPIGYDMEDYKAIPYTKIDLNYINNQNEILKSLHKMGADLTLSCTPYDLPNIKNLKIGNSVAWGESNAVVYANSILGLRTNREGGPISLMAAITGKIYYYGLHINENRIPEIKYVIEKPYNYNIDEVRAGVFGEILSKIHDSDKPPFINETLDKLAMKEFFASLGASGNIAMVYIDKITPEKLGKKILKEVKIDYKEIEKRKEELSPNKKPEVIYLGCPHSSAEDLYKLANILKKTNKKYDVKIVVTLSRSEIQKIESNALKILKDHNVNLIADTCLIVSPFGYKGLSVATNSYKAYFYLSKKGIDVSLISINDIPKVIDND